MNALIELDHVSRTFTTPAGVITAVDSVSLALGQGEAMCLVGESGCGKTTTGRSSRALSVRPAAAFSMKGKMSG
jgi:ABC-type oligopeptide transport system ATPase subunit